MSGIRQPRDPDREPQLLGPGGGHVEPRRDGVHDAHRTLPIPRRRTEHAVHEDPPRPVLDPGHDYVACQMSDPEPAPTRADGAANGGPDPAASVVHAERADQLWEEIE